MVKSITHTHTHTLGDLHSGKHTCIPISAMKKRVRVQWHYHSLFVLLSYVKVKWNKKGLVWTCLLMWEVTWNKKHLLCPVPQNPESLDSSIQSALSALFPPFEVTAPTVLSQLFRTIEERFHGDALHCLLDFLIPSKHLLESEQQAACVSTQKHTQNRRSNWSSVTVKPQGFTLWF